MLFHQHHLQVDDLDIFTIGPKFENNPVFPARTNTEFVEILSRSHVRMVVWERGAGRTLACGTGACATVVAGVLEGKVDRSCQVDLPGGPLHIEWRELDNHIYMVRRAGFINQQDGVCAWREQACAGFSRFCRQQVHDYRSRLFLWRNNANPGESAIFICIMGLQTIVRPTSGAARLLCV